MLRELGIGLVPFSPLGRGFLTGDGAAGRGLSRGRLSGATTRAFRARNFDANMAAAAAVQRLAAQRGATPAQIALAWLLAKGPDIVPIPGTKRRQYLEENCAAASLALTPDEVAQLDSAMPPEVVAGPRYTPQSMAFIDR